MICPGRTSRARYAARARPLRRVLALLAAFWCWSTVGRGQEVTLSLDDYDQLREAARQASSPRLERSPHLAFERADLRIEIGERAARLEQRLTVSLAGPGWHELRLGAIDGGLFTDLDFAALDGRVRATDGAILLRGTGRHQIVATSALAVSTDEKSTARTLSVEVPTPSAGVVLAEVDHDVLEAEVSLSSGAMLISEEERRFTFAAAPGALVQILLQEGQRGHDEVATRYDARVLTTVTTRRTRLRADVEIEFDVQSGRVDRFALGTPAGFEVVGLFGDQLASWDLADGELEGTLTRPSGGAFSLTLQLAAQPTARFPSPLVLPRGAQEVRHYVRGVALGDGYLTMTDVASTRQLDEPEVRALSANRNGAALFEIHDVSRPPTWEVTWSEGVELLAARVDRLLLDLAVGQHGRAGYRLWLAVSNRGLQTLEVQLPAGFELVTATRRGQVVKVGTVGDSIVLPLSMGEREIFSLAGIVSSADPLAGDSFEVKLPSFSAPVDRVEVRLLLPKGARYTLVDPTRGRPLVASGGVERNFEDAAYDGLFDRLPGARELHAGWHALSPSPGPLQITVDNLRTPARWF